MTNAFKLKPVIPTEHEEQKALFQWKEANLRRIPEIDMLFAIPNQAPGSGGYALRQYYKSEGLCNGVPDVQLAVARNGYHGLFIEVKRTTKDKPTADQIDWIERLTQQGYQACICYGCDDAIQTITSYLNER